MPVSLNEPDDLTLINLERVAVKGEKIRFGETAIRTISASNKAFLEYVNARPNEFIYGTTSDYGPNAKNRINDKERQRLKKIGVPFLGLSFGDENLPESAVRSMVFAILGLFLRGGSAVSPKTARALAKRLDGPMPKIPAGGLTSPGEILPLFYLLRAFPELVDEPLCASSGNTAFCSVGLAGIDAITTQRRLTLAQKVFALSFEAIQAPLEHIDPALKPLWNDPYEAVAIDNLSHCLKGPLINRRPFQAPVSYRILPRILGQALRASERLYRCSEESLQSMVSNPMFFTTGIGSKVETISTGGYHNARIPQALDGVSMSWVDLAELARRHIIKLHKGPVSKLPDRLVRLGDHYRAGRTTSYLEFVPADFVDQMRRLSEPTLLLAAEAGASEQDDINANGYIACRNQRQVAYLFDRIMAVLGGVASHALDIQDRQAPLELANFVAEIRKYFPPVTKKRIIGNSAARLAHRMSDAIDNGNSVMTETITNRV